MNNDTKTTHPSFGVASFSRRSCTAPQSLFGSSIGHANTISLTICHAEQIRNDSSYERYFVKGEIIEVEMSAAQFAEMITTMNYGSGVPVTIRHLNGVRIEGCETENKRKQHSDEFKQRMREFDTRLTQTQNRLQELLKKDKLSKEDKLEMKHAFEYISTETRSNIPFYEQMFEEQMDKTVTESKAEIDAFITNTVTKFGLEEIRKQNALKGKDAEDTPIISIL